MPKFSVGDEVVGNENASVHYSITKTGWIGTVLEVNGSNIYVDGPGGKYWVEDCDFDYLCAPVEESEFFQML